MKTRKRKTSVKKRASRPGRRRAPADTAALSLDAECTVAEAGFLKKALMRLLHEPRSVGLEVTALRRIDTAGVQLLAAFVRDRRAAGLRTEWRGRAPALDAAAALLGLRGMLELSAEDGR